MGMLSRIGALATLPLLAGCFDYTQSLSVTADGTATMVLEAVMGAAMLEMDPEAADDDFCPAMDPADIPDGFTATAEQAALEDGAQSCTMTITGPLDSFQAVLNDPEFLPGGVDGEGGAITLTNEGGGRYTYAFTFEIPADDPPEQPLTAEEQAQNAQMEAMMVQMLAEGTLRWELTAPRIISTDGTLDGNTATYEIPLSSMVTGRGTTYTFNVEFALQ